LKRFVFYYFFTAVCFLSSILIAADHPEHYSARKDLSFLNIEGVRRVKNDKKQPHRFSEYDDITCLGRYVNKEKRESLLNAYLTDEKITFLFFAEEGDWENPFNWGIDGWGSSTTYFNTNVYPGHPSLNNRCVHIRVLNRLVKEGKKYRIHLNSDLKKMEYMSFTDVEVLIGINGKINADEIKHNGNLSYISDIKKINQTEEGGVSESDSPPKKKSKLESKSLPKKIKEKIESTDIIIPADKELKKAQYQTAYNILLEAKIHSQTAIKVLGKMLEVEKSPAQLASSSTACLVSASFSSSITRLIPIIEASLASANPYVTGAVIAAATGYTVYQIGDAVYDHYFKDTDTKKEEVRRKISELSGNTAISSTAPPPPEWEPDDKGEDIKKSNPEDEIRESNTKQEQVDAKKLGYCKKIPKNKVPFNSHGKSAFQNKNGQYITRDRDGHNVSNGWKLFDKNGNRIGTYSSDLTVRIKK
jgi:hypothetical protein